MSVRLLGRVLAESEAEGAARLVLIVLADAAQDDGITWVPQRDIAEKARISEGHSRTCIKKLAEDGELEMAKVQRGRSRINVYRLRYAVADVDADRLPFELPMGAFSRPQESCGGASDDRRSDESTTADLTAFSGGLSISFNRKGENQKQEQELSPLTPPSSPVDEVRECWLAHSPPLTAHQAGYFDSKLARKIGKAVEAYGANDVCAAIGAYAAVLASPEHFWNYRWPLAHFLDRGLDRFLPEADPFENFRIRQTDRRGDAVLSVGDMMRQAKEARDDGGTIEAVGRDARRGLPAAADQSGDV